MRHSAAVNDFRQVTAAAVCHNTNHSANTDPSIDHSSPNTGVSTPDKNGSATEESAPVCVSLCCELCNSPVTEEQLLVRYDPSRFNRKLNPAQETAIESRWRRLVLANVRLYNGTKFRLAGTVRHRRSGAPAGDAVRGDDDQDAAVEGCCGRVQLALGLTCYRDHLCTNCCGEVAPLLQQAGVAVHGASQAFLADCLGVGALLLTADNQLVLVRRAAWTGEYPGRMDRPGGHAEPESVQSRPSRTTAVVEEEQQGGWRDGRWPQRLMKLPDHFICREIFDSVCREVSDELGISKTFLSKPLLFALLRDSNCAGRPTLEFIIRCSLPSDEVLRVYREGRHAEADESVGIVFLNCHRLFDIIGQRQLQYWRSIQQQQQQLMPVGSTFALRDDLDSFDAMTAQSYEVLSDNGTEMVDEREEECGGVADGDASVSAGEHVSPIVQGQTELQHGVEKHDGSRAESAGVDRDTHIDPEIDPVTSSASRFDPNASKNKLSLIDVWDEMTPACKASICLLQKLDVEKLAFVFPR